MHPEQMREKQRQRSPTAQLLHSLSYAFSALRIRREMEPQAQTTPLFKTVIAIQVGGMGVITGGMSAFLFDQKDALVGICSSMSRSRNLLP